ncbi:hypothetical protein MPTK1_6g00340 [Marchantia polymorpha subsp. ruderalis]|uniref:CBF1-interacting co-repressor CIR N-terminal domain-containing protein n=2 Tax=Marchantia polymorpha TaxID=3197 RepID=A0AAF6BM08_MARPO|nr:hypothetical protein MARPO_0104s0032 [Marchantia polymorpha]BBN13042.1 hypothetical protein Mp_6g00340 [Marchantia polymorpha subsp. ruderalis]|eukprot:PTQ32003.1 hypothetical protein MARPO_0104s0032 [Marchantia polymorpha]
MALKFLNKKGWHTGSLRNLENVWKAEQKHEAEQKKLEELKVQIHKEREAEELRQQYQAAGLAPKQDRLEFLYDSGAGPSTNKPAEDYNAQRASVESKSDNKPAKPGEKIGVAIPGALFSSETNVVSANDKWRKIHSDPLYLIKQQELAALERIRKNPVKMEMLANQVRQRLKPGKDKEEEDDDDDPDNDDGKHRKKRKKDHKNGKKRDRDYKHEKKVERDGKEKKKNRSDKHRKRRGASDSESSESESGARLSKRRVETDHRIDREAGPDRRSKMSTRDGSPTARRKEERREREGDMNDDRLGREADVGDRYRENNRPSENYHDRNDRSRKSEIERKSTREYDRDYRSSMDHENGDYKQREAFGREERHSRSFSEHDRSGKSHNVSDNRSRTYERDDRPRKEYDVDDRQKRRLI